MATRTWVSANGDDANPGSRTAPCKTFAGAISKTDTNGEIDAIDPGGFGSVTITKSLTIDGTGTLASILATLTNGIIINAAGINVTIRGLTINGSGNGVSGIRIVAAAKVHIEDCEIFGFAAAGSRGIDDRRTTGGQLFVINTTVRDNTDGIIVKPTTGSTQIQCFMNRLNIVGQTNVGLNGSSGSRVTIANSLIAWNVTSGIVCESPAGATAELDAEACVIVANNEGLRAAAGATVRISNLRMVGNTTALVGGGGTFGTFGNNHIAGNGGGNTVPGAPPVIGPQ